MGEGNLEPFLVGEKPFAIGREMCGRDHQVCVCVCVITSCVCVSFTWWGERSEWRDGFTRCVCDRQLCVCLIHVGGGDGSEWRSPFLDPLRGLLARTWLGGDAPIFY